MLEDVPVSPEKEVIRAQIVTCVEGNPLQGLPKGPLRAKDRDLPVSRAHLLGVTDQVADHRQSQAEAHSESNQDLRPSGPNLMPGSEGQHPHRQRQKQIHHGIGI
jgi:hypothetical protein